MRFARAAMTHGDSLPTDPDALRVLPLAERAYHAEELERLMAIIKELQRHRFGRRAERLDPKQLALALEDVEQTLAAVDAAAENDSTARKQATPRRRQINRGALPSHLPREEIIIDVADKTCACCGGLKHRIGEDVSERLDVIPAQFKVIVTRRPKYACQACACEVAQPPERLIENGIPTEALVAHVLIAKYADHTPLYRQTQIYARQGITLDRSTLADWVGRAAFALQPVHRRLLEQLKQSTKLFADETTAPVLDPGRGRVKKGQLWAYARDERPWAGRAPPGVTCATCSPSRVILWVGSTSYCPSPTCRRQSRLRLENIAYPPLHARVARRQSDKTFLTGLCLINVGDSCNALGGRRGRDDPARFRFEIVTDPHRKRIACLQYISFGPRHIGQLQALR
jgi:transposase